MAALFNTAHGMDAKSCPAHGFAEKIELASSGYLAQCERFIFDRSPYPIAAM
jgi:hypothetical protein